MAIELRLVILFRPGVGAHTIVMINWDLIPYFRALYIIPPKPLVHPFYMGHWVRGAVLEKHGGIQNRASIEQGEELGIGLHVLPRNGIGLVGRERGGALIVHTLVRGIPTNADRGARGVKATHIAEEIQKVDEWDIESSGCTKVKKSLVNLKGKGGKVGWDGARGEGRGGHGHRHCVFTVDQGSGGGEKDQKGKKCHSVGCLVRKSGYSERRCSSLGYVRLRGVRVVWDASLKGMKQLGNCTFITLCVPQ